MKEEVKNISSELKMMEGKINQFESIVMEKWNKMNTHLENQEQHSVKAVRTHQKGTQIPQSLTPNKVKLPPTPVWKQLEERITTKLSDQYDRRMSQFVHEKQTEMQSLREHIHQLTNISTSICPTQTVIQLGEEATQTIILEVEEIEAQTTLQCQEQTIQTEVMNSNSAEVQTILKQFETVGINTKKVGNKNEQMQTEMSVKASRGNQTMEEPEKVLKSQYLKCAKQKEEVIAAKDLAVREREDAVISHTKIITEKDRIIAEKQTQILLYQQQLENYATNLGQRKQKIQQMHQNLNKQKTDQHLILSEVEPRLALEDESQKKKNAVEILKQWENIIQELHQKVSDFVISTYFQEQNHIEDTLSSEKNARNFTSLKEQNNILTNQVIILSKNYQKLSQSNEALTHQLSQLIKSRERLFEKKDKNKEEDGENIKLKNQEIQCLKKEVVELQNQIKQMEEQSMKKAKLCKVMTDERILEIQRLRGQKNKHLEEIQYLKSHIEIIDSELKQMEKKNNASLEKLIQAQEEKIQFQKKIGQLNQKNEQMEKQLEGIHRQLRIRTEEKEKCGEEKEQLKVKIMKLETQIETYKTNSQKIIKKDEKQSQTSPKKKKLNSEIVVNINACNSDPDHAFIDDEVHLKSPRAKEIEAIKSNPGQVGQNSDVKVTETNFSKSMHMETTPIAKLKIEDKDESHNNFMNHQSNSVYNADLHVLNLSQENKKLKEENSKLLEEVRKLSESVFRVEEFADDWNFVKKEKAVQKMIQVSHLKERIQLIAYNKEKVFKSFDHNELEALCNDLTSVIDETRKWVDIIDSLACQGKKKALLIHPKLYKRKTSKQVHCHREIDEARSVFSEGATPKKEIPEFDTIPFDLEMGEMNSLPINSLEKMFSDHKDLSQISSVKHQSQYSDFLHSKSQIVNILQKEGGMKIKKDIFDEYVHPISNNYLNPEKEKKIYCMPYDLTKEDLGRKFEEKSNNSKRRSLNKAINKFKKIDQHYGQTIKNTKSIIEKIIEHYEAKIKKMEKQFAKTVNLLIKEEKGFQKSYSPKKIDILKENYQSQLGVEKQKNESLHLQLREKDVVLDKLQKLLQQKHEIINEQQKRYKEDKIKFEKVQEKIQQQKKTNTDLRLRNNQMKKQFNQFMSKLTLPDSLIKQKKPEIQEAEIQVSVLQDNIQMNTSIIKTEEIGIQTQNVKQQNAEIQTQKQDQSQIQSQRNHYKEKEKDLQVCKDQIISLEEQILHLKNENNEKSFFQFLRDIIVQYEIPQILIEKNLSTQEKINGESKYAKLRIFIKSLSSEFQKINKSQREKAQIQKEQRQLAKRQKDLLNEKNNQIQKLRDELQSIKLKKVISNKSLASQKSSEQQFYQFAEKKEFDNTKPIAQQIEILKKQLEIYQQKCKQYEANLHPKKKEVIYIRR